MPSDVEKVLTAQGPAHIPAWAYGVGLAAAYLGFEYFRGKNTAPAAPPSTSPPGTTTTTVKQSGKWWGGWGNDGGMAPPPTNTEWAHQVEDWLDSKGYPAGRAARGVEDYLTGVPMDREQRKMMDLAIDVFGGPPQGREQSGTAANMSITAGTSAMDEDATGANGSDTSVTQTGSPSEDPDTAREKRQRQESRQRTDRRRRR
jgi:hypothetical protein